MRNRLLVAIVGLLAGSGFVFSAGPEDPPLLATASPVSQALSGPGAGAVTPTGLWVNGEFFFGWFKKGPLPAPLATPGSAEDAGPDARGQPETEVEHPITLPGGRLSAGFWLNPQQSLAVEARGFLLDGGTDRQAISPDAVGTPDNLSGSLVASSTARLWGTEANVLVCLCRACEFRVDLIEGLRYLDLAERLQIDQLSPDFDALPPAPLLAATDSFHTRNQFFGGQLGGRLQYQASNEAFSLDVRALVGLGTNRQTIDVSETTTQARTSNRGRVTRDQLSVSPQAEFRVCYQPVDCLRVFVGYGFLCLSSVTRPGDHISLNTVHDSLFCVQAISLGGEFCY